MSWLHASQVPHKAFVVRCLTILDVFTNILNARSFLDNLVPVLLGDVFALHVCLLARLYYLLQ
jgi:hypothetical protein